MERARTGLVEEVVEEQVLELRVLRVRLRDVTKEDTVGREHQHTSSTARRGRLSPLDDASSAPHESNAGKVEVPLVLDTGLAHEHEALTYEQGSDTRHRSRTREGTERTCA